MARVKDFDGPCLIIYSLFTIYRDIHYWLFGIFGIFDFANLIFQTEIIPRSNYLGKKIKLDISNWRMSKIPKIQVQIDRRCVLHYRVFEYDVQDFALRKFYYCVTQCHFVTVVITFRCTTIFFDNWVLSGRSLFDAHCQILIYDLLYLKTRI